MGHTPQHNARKNYENQQQKHHPNAYRSNGYQQDGLRTRNVKKKELNRGVQ